MGRFGRALAVLLGRDTASVSVDAAIQRSATDMAGGSPPRTSERGSRATPESSMKYLYRQMWVDPDRRAAVLDIRTMDREDPRVKKIHSRTARAAVKGGLRLKTSSDNRELIAAWRAFERRLQLKRHEKLESHMRGMMIEGNLALQWILGPDRNVVNCVRMPSETLLPNVDRNGRFVDAARAYTQHDLTTGQELATFGLWELSLNRLDPDNWDDAGSFGRPYLDAMRATWLKLRMTEEDLVIRRRERAPLRTAHVLEGANVEELLDYKARIEDDQKEITTNYYLNKKGGVQAVQGDANLNEIEDIVHLLDTFFSGSPAAKGMFGYNAGLNRDILEDLKAEFFDELDALQDTAAAAYEYGFRLELLLKGIDPDLYEFSVGYAERRTETPNQAADRALKLQALGASRQTVWETAQIDPAKELAQRTAEANSADPYPDTDSDVGADDAPSQPRPRVSITPGNRGKGESATSITNG